MINISRIHIANFFALWFKPTVKPTVATLKTKATLAQVTRQHPRASNAHLNMYLRTTHGVRHRAKVERVSKAQSGKTKRKSKMRTRKGSKKRMSVDIRDSKCSHPAPLAALHTDTYSRGRSGHSFQAPAPLMDHNSQTVVNAGTATNTTNHPDDSNISANQAVDIEDSRKVGGVHRHEYVAACDASPRLAKAYDTRNCACEAWENAFKHAKTRCEEYECTDPCVFTKVLEAKCTATPRTNESVADVIAREAVLIATLSVCPTASLFAQTHFLAGDILIRPLANEMKRTNMSHPCVVVGAGVVVDLYQPYEAEALVQTIIHSGRSAAYVRAVLFDCAKHTLAPVWVRMQGDHPTLGERFRRCMRAVSSVGPCWFHPIQATCWNHLSVWNGQSWHDGKVKLLPQTDKAVTGKKHTELR